MRFSQNGLANFFLGCICSYGVANAVDLDLVFGALLIFGIAGLTLCIYAYPID